jgi:ubiquinone/menaquinone biosynthesis C-methylase UbiE
VTDRATSFGPLAAEYDRLRPEYSPAAIDLAVARLGLEPDAEVLDLGAGTGKLTRPLVERFRHVVAVEPDPGMLAVLRRTTDVSLAVEGPAEAIPLGDDSVDAVFVGQAFHWFEPDRALAEIARVLRPCGGVVLIWNKWRGSAVPAEAVEVMKAVIERPGLASTEREDDWLAAFPRFGFEQPRSEQVAPVVLTLDGSELVALNLTTSAFATLPPDERDAVRARLEELVVGEQHLPVETDLYWTRLAR